MDLLQAPIALQDYLYLHKGRKRWWELCENEPACQKSHFSLCEWSTSKKNQLMMKKTPQNITNMTSAFSNSHAYYPQNENIFPISMSGSSIYKLSLAISTNVWTPVLRRDWDNLVFFFLTLGAAQLMKYLPDFQGVSSIVEICILRQQTILIQNLPLLTLLCRCYCASQVP